MVGRGIYQVQYPNTGGDNNTYSNQLVSSSLCMKLSQLFIIALSEFL